MAEFLSASTSARLLALTGCESSLTAAVTALLLGDVAKLLGALKVADGYNNDGGTVMTLADPGRVFIGFGKEQNRARDATDGDADYVLEYDAHDDALVFEMRVPRPHWKSGDFSLLPTVSIDGETRLGAAHSR